MAIDPTKSGGIPAYDATRAAAQKPAQREKRTDDAERNGAASRAAADQVQLSSASRGLVETAQAPAPVENASAVGLTADRLKTVLERLQSGYYDSPAVRNGIARGIRTDLGTE